MMSDWIEKIIEVAAILLSPLIAVWVGEKLNHKKQRYDAKFRILTSIMANRHSRFSHEAIQALNGLEIIFWDTPKVRDRYRSYLDSVTGKNLADKALSDESDRRFQELVAEMAKSLKLNISGTDFSRWYIPQAMSTERALYDELVRTLLLVLRQVRGFRDDNHILNFKQNYDATMSPGPMTPTDSAPNPPVTPPPGSS